MSPSSYTALWPSSQPILLHFPFSFIFFLGGGGGSYEVTFLFIWQKLTLVFSYHQFQQFPRDPEHPYVSTDRVLLIQHLESFQLAIKKVPRTIQQLQLVVNHLTLLSSHQPFQIFLPKNTCYLKAWKIFRFGGSNWHGSQKGFSRRLKLSGQI